MWEAAHGGCFQRNRRRHAVLRFGYIHAENVARQVESQHLLFAVLGHQVTFHGTTTHHVKTIGVLAFAKDMLTLAVNAFGVAQLLLRFFAVQQNQTEATAARLTDVALVYQMMGLNLG